MWPGTSVSAGSTRTEETTAMRGQREPHGPGRRLSEVLGPLHPPCPARALWPAPICSQPCSGPRSVPASRSKALPVPPPPHKAALTSRERAGWALTFSSSAIRRSSRDLLHSAHPGGGTAFRTLGLQPPILARHRPGPVRRQSPAPRGFSAVGNLPPLWSPGTRRLGLRRPGSAPSVRLFKAMVPSVPAHSPPSAASPGLRSLLAPLLTHRC